LLENVHSRAVLAALGSAALARRAGGLCGKIDEEQQRKKHWRYSILEYMGNGSTRG
jgi:hypothetical protein